MMRLSDGRKSFRIRLAVLIQHRSVTDTQPASHPASHPASQPRCRSYYAQRSASSLKTKELVFRRRSPRLVVLPVPLDQIEQVHCTKLLGIYLSDTLQFETHLVNVLKICSQRPYLVKLLRGQGMPRTHLYTVLGPSYLPRSPMHYQPEDDFLLSSKLDGSIPFLSEHLNMVCAPSCSYFSRFG